MSVTQRMRILKTVELADFAEKNAKRIRILKTVGFADFAEKNAKRIRILKEREFECCCSAERIEAIAMQCTFVMPIPREKNLQSVIVFRMFLKTFSFAKQCFLRSFESLQAPEAEGFQILGSLPFSEEPKRIRQKISRKSTENRMTKRMGFHKKRSEVCKVYRFR